MAGLENLVAAAAFPDHAAIYWRRALEVRPVVLSGLVAKFAQTRAADSRVVVEGFVSAPAACRFTSGSQSCFVTSTTRRGLRAGCRSGD